MFLVWALLVANHLASYKLFWSSVVYILGFISLVCFCEGIGRHLFCCEWGLRIGYCYVVTFFSLQYQKSLFGSDKSYLGRWLVPTLLNRGSGVRDLPRQPADNVSFLVTYILPVSMSDFMVSPEFLSGQPEQNNDQHSWFCLRCPFQIHPTYIPVACGCNTFESIASPDSSLILDS